MDKKERLQKLIDHYSNGNKTSFATMIGVTPQGLSSWLARDTFDIERIYANCVGVSADWLLTGQGEMINNNETKTAHGKKIVKSDDGKGIPLIPVSAIAGFPADGWNEGALDGFEYYRIPEFENKGADFLIRVSGDSMTPLYYSGDLLACHKISDIRFFQWGTVYVLETSQGVIVKRVLPDDKHDDCILCVSENNAVHKPFLLPKDDIRSLSTIIGLVRLV